MRDPKEFAVLLEMCLVPSFSWWLCVHIHWVTTHFWSCLLLSSRIFKLLYTESTILYKAANLLCMNCAHFIFGTDADIIGRYMTELSTGASNYVLVDILIGWENCLPHALILWIICRALSHKRLKSSSIIMVHYSLSFCFSTLHIH